MTTTVPVSTADYRHKKVFEGFKEFISRGNTLDMAVGVVMGNAVTAIVKSLVSNFLNPLIAMIFGKPDMSGLLQVHFNGATISFGAILNDILNFLLVALAVYFCVIVPINKFRPDRQGEEEPRGQKAREFWKHSDKDSTTLARIPALVRTETGADTDKTHKRRRIRGPQSQTGAPAQVRTPLACWKKTRKHKGRCSICSAGSAASSRRWGRHRTHPTNDIAQAAGDARLR